MVLVLASYVSHSVFLESFVLDGYLCVTFSVHVGLYDQIVFIPVHDGLRMYEFMLVQPFGLQSLAT